MKVGIRSYQKDDDAVENSQITHDVQHSFLLRTYNVGGTHQFCRTAKLGMSASGCHLGGCFTTPHQCSRIGVNAWTSLNGQRFAC